MSTKDYKKDHLLPSLRESIDNAAGYIAANLQDNCDSPESIALAFQDVIQAYDLPIDVSVWYPIETAPRDGTPVLLAWHWNSGTILQSGEEHKGVAVVLDSWYCRTHVHLSRHKDCPNEPDCRMGWGAYGGEMSHWMPVPPPPEPSK